MSRTLAENLAWGADGAAHLRALMGRMGDDAFAAPCALPGWSRAHLLTHIARDGDAMVSLLSWARTGRPAPAYPSRAQRDAEIETGAKRPPAEIRADVIDSSDRLARVVKAMPGPAWQSKVQDSRGRQIPATDIAWQRAREMWIHSVDLDVGATLADMPIPMLCELVSDLTADIGADDDVAARAAPGCLVPVRLVATDVPREWQIGAGTERTEPGRIDIEGPLADLATWLARRGCSRAVRVVGGGKVPQLAGWLCEAEPGR